jgi:hypothetical protein
MKICTRCGARKEIDEFSRDKHQKDGRRSACKVCTRAQRIAYYYVHREDEIAKVRAWQVDHKPSVRIANNKHRKKISKQVYARKKRATPSWASSEWEKLLSKEARHLAQLRSKMTGQEWETDHIVPIAGTTVCGLHTGSNLQVILKTENAAKANHTWPDMP